MNENNVLVLDNTCENNTCEKKSETIQLALYSLALGALFSLCFTGKDVLPGLSFTVFCWLSIILFFILCKKLNRIRNKRGFLWAAPILVLSFMNCIFSFSIIHYLNVLAVHYLFAIMALRVTEETKLSDDIYQLFANALCCIFQNVFKAIPIFSILVKKSESQSRLKKVLIACLLSMPVIIIVLLLLIDADQVFSFYVEEISRVVFSVNTKTLMHIMIIPLAAAYFACYGSHLFYDDRPAVARLSAKGDHVMLGTFLTLLNLLFAAFCLIQLLFLFTGGFMTLPEDIVYSEYARSGFFQLLFVTVINFAVLIVCLEFVQVTRQFRSIKNLLIFLCVFTGILIASSVYRMLLYIGAYNFTQLRLMVLTFLAMESILLLFTLCHLIKGSILYKPFAYTGMAFLLVLNVTGSGYFACRLNYEVYYHTMSQDKLDVSYFSMDSAPLLLDIYNDSDTSPVLKDAIEEKILSLYTKGQKTRSDYIWQNYSILESSGYKAVEEWAKD